MPSYSPNRKVGVSRDQIEGSFLLFGGNPLELSSWDFHRARSTKNLPLGYTARRSRASVWWSGEGLRPNDRKGFSPLPDKRDGAHASSWACFSSPCHSSFGSRQTSSHKVDSLTFIVFVFHRSPDTTRIALITPTSKYMLVVKHESHCPVISFSSTFCRD